MIISDGSHHRLGKNYCVIDTTQDSQISYEAISLKDARKRLVTDLGKIEINKEAKIYLITYPNGIGKTHHIAKLLKNRYKVLWLCAIHELAQSVIRGHFNNTDVAELKSRKYMISTGELICDYESDINHLDPKDEIKICRNYCKRRYKCEYYQNNFKSRKSNIVFGMHAHLQITDFIKHYIKKSDCIVIDESFSNHYVGEERFHETDLERSIALLSNIAKVYSLDNKIIDTVNSLIDYFKDLLSNRIDSNVNDFPVIDGDFRRIYKNELRQEGCKEDIISTFEYLSKNNFTIVRRDDYFSYIKVAQLPTDITVIILDASGNAGFYERMLNRKVIVYGQNCHIKQIAYVTQFLDGSYPLSSLLNVRTDKRIPMRSKTYYKIMRLIRVIKHKHYASKIVIGTMKSVEIKLRADNIEESNTRIIHYYDVRGINDYANYDVLIILGTPMLSFKEMAREARILFNQNWNDEQMAKQMNNNGKVWVKSNYSDNGKGYAILTFEFSNKYVQEYYQHTVIAEMTQMFGRIRPYQGKDKYVYIIANTQIPGVKIDRMITIKEFIKEEGELIDRRSEMRNIALAIQQMPNSKFTVKELALKLLELTGQDRTSKTKRHHIKEVIRKNLDYFKVKIIPNKHIIERL